MSSQFHLLKEGRFRPFFLTQLLGALNDNVFKTALITLLTFRAGSITDLSPALLATVLPGVFILPFFLFSATCGQLADKYDRAMLARLSKLLEIVVMALGAWGFIAGNLPALVLALFLMGTQSTLFGPVKYAYLPQHLHDGELVGGNGLVESGTFVAILGGQILGAWLVGNTSAGAIALVVLALAVLGWWTSRGIPLSPPPEPAMRLDWNPLSATRETLRFATGNRTVWLSLLGVSWFWFYGATLLAQFPVYAAEVLGGGEGVFILLLAVFSVGVGAGSLACEKLSGGKVEIGLVPFGAIGLTLFGIDLFFATPSAPAAYDGSAAGFLRQGAHWRLLIDIALLGTAGGIYIVPLYALIQSRCEKHHVARIIAANNILNAGFMVVSALVSLLLFRAGLDIPQLFLVTALFNAVVAIYIYTLVPEFLMRFIVWILIHTVYRLDTRDLERIPDDGPAVVVCNHVSFVDALVITAACRRPIRFVMDHRIFRTPILSFVFRTNRCIPIAPAKEDPVLLERAYEEIAAALEAGDLVGLFPEGRITDTGELYPFKPGITRIVGRTPVPVIPLALRGLWGSFFSRKDGPAMCRVPRRGPFSRIELVAGDAVAPDAATPAALQALVARLRGDRR
ncbi:MFS transporter [Methyloversatilis sp.]|uniref:MFS transporter n=1 Tax=Methyloversatilis sp. TaxID=2569862 RepID=UPI0027364ED9|nr:MFS transporter [Methyloversatilis sp.]MDP2868568.1 MFS transporter [Methyloversatilis sp.]MDP3287970.1 MFS transporter [Methyloversatilis sp.]MDP3457278.1 MFS transporter [Methyloversatilis sp.]MDP3576670.1 MFS transporter [Methyloversatilis sp.]